MATTKKLMGTTAVGGALAIEDVFSTYLYTGNGSTQTITNGIDLAGEGGMVWIKNRSQAQSNYLSDTENGANNQLLSDNTAGLQSVSDRGVTAFNTDGFSLGSSVAGNRSGDDFASWTFRKAPRWFDVVTYTGTGSARTVSHNLGVAPGMVIVKRTNSADEWTCYHRSVGATKWLALNQTAAAYTSASRWNDTEPTDSVFTVGTDTSVNSASGTYVAYLFAHDPLGPSGDGSDGLIACGSYSDASATTVDLGWEPQWVMIKRTDTTYPWGIIHNMSGWTADGNDQYVKPNASDTEQATTWLKLNSTGFETNGYGGTYIYIAIRRGPMRQPESGTEVFDVTELSSPYGKTINTGWPVDMTIHSEVSSTGNRQVIDRLRGTKSSGPTVYLSTNLTSAEATFSAYGYGYDNNNGYINNLWGGTDGVFWDFRRAPGFFDVVAYTGDSPGGIGTQVINHNLGVPPEMIIFKSRSATGGWGVLNTHLPLVSGLGQGAYLNETSAFAASGWWGSPYVAPTSSDFLVRGSTPNASGQTYIAYLFATLPGVSKVGSYTGNGSSQTINCGFTSGARFILIKRTDSTGDWYVWDTERGIVAANDPHLSLNTTAAQVTTDDSVDPDSSGFIVNQVAATNINVSSASYIFYAIA